MGLIHHNSLLKTGVQRFDDDHLQLVTITNQLHDAIKAGFDLQTVQRILQELAVFAEHHFKAEEELLAHHDYPDLEQHRLAHQQIMTRLEQLRHDPEQAHGSIIMQFLLDWLVNHTKNADTRYGPFLNRRGLF